jgi:hypothetical protein
MAIFATIAFIGSAVLAAYQLTPKLDKVTVDDELLPY